MSVPPLAPATPVVTPEGMITLFPTRKNLFDANKLETAFFLGHSKIRFCGSGNFSTLKFFKV